MNSQDIIEQLDVLNASTQIYRTNETYIEPMERWGALIEVCARSGVKLSIRARGATFDEALSSAWTQLLPHLTPFHALLP